VIEILECFEFSKGKIDVCKLLTPRIYDLQQSKKHILEKLDFVQDREEVDNYFKEYLSGSSTDAVNQSRI
jgi:hypothetical protein